MRALLLVMLFAATAVADPKPTVTVTTKTIELSQPIYFEVGKAVIKEDSYPLLDQLAATLVAQPKIGLVEIQGHTDERGAEAFNLKQSDDRAHAVLDYLVGKGIDSKRLRAKGYGETKPLDRAHNEKAWSKNRRTAFVILQRRTT
ncbi:MAG: OmpA family protein [Kofleriaceae bacterium]